MMRMCVNFSPACWNRNITKSCSRGTGREAAARFLAEVPGPGPAGFQQAAGQGWMGSVPGDERQAHPDGAGDCHYRPVAVTMAARRILGIDALMEKPLGPAAAARHHSQPNRWLNVRPAPAETADFDPGFSRRCICARPMIIQMGRLDEPQKGIRARLSTSCVARTSANRTPASRGGWHP